MGNESNLNNKPTQALVEQWMSMTTGAVYYASACDDQFEKEHRPHLRVIFSRLAKEGKIEPVVGKDGWYRWVEDTAKPIPWQDYEKTKDSGLLLPFNLRQYVFIYPDTTTVVAGSKSSGKSGFLYRTVVLNMNSMNTILLTNLEGGVGMLRDRFDAMDIKIPYPAPFQVIPVYENFHDYIKQKNTLYVIDYIDVPEDGESFYLIGARIKRVDHKLQGLNSVAVIGLQKPIGRDMAFGGEQTIKAATLYLAMDNKKLKIVDAKVPADPKVHPRNMQWTFTYSEQGTKFENIKQSQSQTEWQQ